MNFIFEKTAWIEYKKSVGGKPKRKTRLGRNEGEKEKPMSLN